MAILLIAGRRPEFDAICEIVLCMGQLNLSARAYHRILKSALTIADLAGSEEIQSVRLAEALHASRSSQIDAGVNQKLNFLIRAFFVKTG